MKIDKSQIIELLRERGEDFKVNEAQDELPNFTPAVNQIYPTTYPLATFPPGVLTHLPALPEPLEYRFVQRNLILRDIQSNLIVDVLADAAPAMDSLAPPHADR